MTLAEVYEALGKLDGGEALASTIKAEISKINAEAAKQRTAKNASDAKITELEAKVQELTEKGTGDRAASGKMEEWILRVFLYFSIRKPSISVIIIAI